MNNGQKFAAVLTAGALYLTGCSWLDDEAEYTEESSTAESVPGSLTEESEPGKPTEETENSAVTGESVLEMAPQGSVKTLEGSSIIVTVVMDTPDITYTQEEISFANGLIDKSCRYLEEQGRLYGKSVTLYNYSSEHQDLIYYLESGEDSSNAVDSSLAYSNGYMERMQQFLKDSIPIDELCEDYGTDSIGFMVLYDVPGNSYSQVYYPGYDDTFYEWTALFEYDIYGSRKINLACVAHELLHLFGAVDLYRYSGIDGVTEEIYNEVMNDPAYSMEIMRNTYNEDGSYDYDNIPQFLGDITLAMIGFTDGSEVYEKYPSLERTYPAAFEIKYY